MEFTSRHLRGFHLVAQHGSFSRAAEALFITLAGLSWSLIGLAEWNGWLTRRRRARWCAAVSSSPGEWGAVQVLES
jgi:Bacterial regulatory helix-turn-helix protein, lysR family